MRIYVTKMANIEMNCNKRAENIVPQLDGTYNVSDDSNTDSHSYLDLAIPNIKRTECEGKNRDMR